LVVCGLLLSYQRGFCDPLDTPVQDGSGAVWANHDSDDGAYKQLSFQSILGVGYRIEKSNNLVNWTNFAQFYGVGNTVTWNLFANPVPEDQNSGGNQAPVEEDTRKSATLVMNKADTGELVLGWTSLDTAEAVQYVLTGLSIADEWNTNPIVGHSTDDYHFTMLLMTRYNGVIPQNSQLGALDTAMIADFSSNFATINQSVIDNAAASQLAPPPLPPDPSSKVFFRLAVNAKLDSDFDGIPDVLECQNGNSSSFSHDSDGDGFSDGAENDQGTNPNDANDKPEIEALIVTGNAEAGVEISQKRKIIIPAGSPNRLIVVALQSDEYPSYTSGDLCEGECPFNDQLRWHITLSNGEIISGQVDVNDLHEKWETESDTFLGKSPVYFQEVKVVESKPDQDVVVEVEVGATNIEDGALPSTVMVGLLPVEVRDVNGAGEADDLTITPWDTSENIANNNIAWIDAHQSAQNAAPRMPQLEFRVPGLPQGLTIEAKLNVQYTRGNDPAHGRAHLTRAEDRVRIPADGNFTQVNGDTWQLYSEADWQTELTRRGFFGGKATLTYQIKRGADVVVGPEEIDFRIGGENPDDARCRTYIESHRNAGPDGNLWFAYAIAKSESRDYNGGGSRYNQFLELPNHRRDVGRPLFGDDRDSRNRPVGPGGYGMFQITGNVNDHNVDIPRRQYWNWQDQINAAIPILASKRAIADRWMNNEALRPGTNIPDGQRPQARRDRGVNVPVPNRTVRGILFSDDANSDRVGPIEDAVAIKAYNSANPHYCSWGGNAAGWRFNNTNGSGFDYVDRVCQEVENDE